jgi:hypothetical protein
MDVGPLVDLAAFQLFRGHIRQGPGEGLRAGEGQGLVHRPRRAEELCQPEIEQLDQTFGRDHDVPWLEIAVDQAFSWAASSLRPLRLSGRLIPAILREAASPQRDQVLSRKSSALSIKSWMVATLG